MRFLATITVRVTLAPKTSALPRASHAKLPQKRANLTPPTETGLHFLSREPAGFDATLLQQLVRTTTVDMGLNPENRPLNITRQEGCW
jgi:hypothetical protein